MVTYKLWFNSGQSNGVPYGNMYQTGDNVSLIEITNSESDYYQNGVITLFDVPSSQSVGQTILVQINDADIFNGYISRVGQTSEGGTISQNYQVIGKTYDLWRYSTDDNALYSGTTSYIISSILVNYCPGISGGGVYNESGTLLTNETNLTNSIVGNVIGKLSDIDGYKFYVDNTGIMHYYDPTDSDYLFTVQEKDIFGDMPLLEQSDDDLVNDCRVLGGDSYSYQTIPSSEPFTNNDTIPNGRYIASRFKAEDDVLSAVRLYLNRTTDPYQPSTLSFEIWKGASAEMREDGEYNGYDFQYMSSMSWDNGVNGVHIYGDAYSGEYKYFVLISGQIINKLDLAGTTNCYNAIQYYAQTFMVTGSSEDDRFLLQRVRFKKGIDGVKATASVLEIRKCDSNNPATAVPLSDILCSAGYNQTDVPGGLTQGLSPQRWLSSNTMYAAVFHRVNVSDKIRMQGNAASQHPSGRCLRSADNSSWSIDSVVADLRFKTWTVNSGSYDYNGPHANTTTWTVPYSVDRIRVSAQVYSGTSYDYSCLRTIKFSASTDSGSSWNYVGYNDDNYHPISNAGKNIILDIFFKSSAVGLTPSLSKVKWEISSSTGAGYPISSEKVEFSDDLSWDTTDIPYPPSYSAWEGYSSPKLQLVKDEYYWFILYNTSGGSMYWDYYYDPNTNYSDGDAMYADTPYQASDWNSFSPDRKTLIFKLGWKDATINARASNQASIETYGRHFKMINDSTITTQEEAQALADATVAGTENIPYVGSFAINGRTDVALNSKISSNLTNLQISSSHDLISYTHKLNENGFQTILEFGKPKFNIMKRISDLETTTFGGG